MRTVSGREAKPVTLHGAAALERLKQEGQYDSFQTAMNQARLNVAHATHTPLGRPAWHAPNAAAGYDAYVTEAGVSLAVNPQSYVSLRLTEFGYGASLRPAVPGEVSGEGQTITIRRDGLREWFVNSREGLEHGFTLSQPPGVRQQGAPLRLALQVDEGWCAMADEGGEFVTLRGAGDAAVEYGKLAVHDARGVKIPGRLTVAEEHVVIEVEDDNAAYPLTIDPIFTLQQKLLAADAEADDYFGHAVALKGDTALIGVPYDDVTQTDQGSAYVFVRSGATWVFQQRLVSNDAAAFDLFGWSVALNGDTALISAYNGPGPAGADQGAAYVFVRNGTAWTQQKRLNASDGLAAGLFGTAVALDGDTALVGAADYRVNANLAPGAAYIFVRQGTNWTEQARLTANDGSDGDRFGEAVALEGDTAFVGAPYDQVGTNVNQGSAYVFTRNGILWGARQKLTVSSGAAGDQFGSALALSGDKAVVGEPHFNNHGAVVTFRRGEAGWTRWATTFAPNPRPGAQFGIAVALHGDTLLVGASLALFGVGADQRSAYAFVYNDDWFFVRQFGLGLGAAEDRFGYAVALDGDAVLIGAYRTNAAATAQGAAYVFTLHDSRHDEQQKLIASDGAPLDRFGEAVALSGDTLVVGAPRDDIGTNQDQGSAYVFVRNGAAWTFQRKLTANDGAAGDNFGGAVAVSGDVVVVGAGSAKVGDNLRQGAAYVFARSGTAQPVWMQQQKLTQANTDGLPNDRFGVSVAFDGQTIVAGAYGVNDAQGAVYVFTLSGAAWTQQAKLLANNSSLLGTAVALSGDTVAAGASFEKIGVNFEQGAAYIFTRSGTVWTQQKKVFAADGAAGDRFGSSVALDGDLLVVGAPLDAIGANNQQGSVYPFIRSGTNWTPWPKLTANNGAADDRFGSSVALSGDTLAVGAQAASGASISPGAVYVFTLFGTWTQQQKLLASDGAMRDGFGYSVALSGDTVAVGATYDEIGSNASQGSAYVFVSPACQAITIAPATLAGGVAGAAYNQPLTVSGGSNSEYRFAVVAGALPPGVTVQGDQGLGGTPTTPGTYRFTLKATYYLSACSSTRDYVITISPCPPLTIGPQALPNGAAGAVYSQQFTVSGGTAPYSFTISAGALPPGLSLNAGGGLNGTPTQAGSYNFSVTATSTGCTGARAYTLTITAPCSPITVNPPTLSSGMVGAAYGQALSATVGSEPYSFSVTTGLLPPGLNLSASGVLSGTPTQAGGFSFTVTATAANGCTGGRLYSLLVNQSGGATAGLQFFPLAHPVRLLDTRAGQLGCYTPGAQIPANSSLNQMARGVCDGLMIPANALAVTGNITTVNSGGGYLTLYPSNAAQPLVANTNYLPNEIVNNVFTVGLGNDGAFKIYALSPTDVVVDVTGYYAPPAAGGLYFHPLPKPIRLLETRPGEIGCDAPGAAIQGGDAGTRTQQGRVSCGGVTIPNAALAIVGNATTVGPAGPGYLTLYPAGAAKPLVASSNYWTNQIVNGPFTVGLSASGAFNIFTLATTHLVVDVLGYYSTEANDGNGAGLLFNPLPKPVRLLETRAGQVGCYTPNAPLSGNTEYSQQARGTCSGETIPNSALAIVGNATVVNAQGGYLTLWPSNAAKPLVAASNFNAGQVFNRHFTVGLGPDGAFKIYSLLTTDLVVDVAGFFAP